MSVYDLKSISLPVLTGSFLKIAANIIENRFLKGFVSNQMLKEGGILDFRKIKFTEEPCCNPLDIYGNKNSENRAGQGALLKKLEAEEPENNSAPFVSVKDYARAYRAGTVDPVEIATKIIKAVKDSQAGKKSMNLFIAMSEDDLLKQAKESAARIKQGKAIGVFDGVPVAVKDELAQAPYPTTVGTSFLGKERALYDATVVKRLRDQGVLLIGKANMHEIGINPNGLNVHYGAVRNPFNMDHDTGGSSSGPAAVVACGIAPVALGTDGGGSIRIPAAYCGINGIKPTFGRVSECGAAPLCWSVAHIGPLAASVEDLVLAYSAIAGPDQRDMNSQCQPDINIKSWNRGDLKGIKMGLFKEWNRHADSDCVKACEKMVDHFEKAGAEIEYIEIPELNAMRVAHTILIISEMATAMDKYGKDLKKMGSAVRINLALGQILKASDYVNANRMRKRAIDIFSEILTKVDAIITPGSATTVPAIPNGWEKAGWSSLSTEVESMRYVFAGNLTGFPAISFPGGYDKTGLAVGVQAMAGPWQEDLLFRIAYNAEKNVKRELPEKYYKILE